MSRVPETIYWAHSPSIATPRRGHFSYGGFLSLHARRTKQRGTTRSLVGTRPVLFNFSPFSI